jgi:hypothetical protein
MVYKPSTNKEFYMTKKLFFVSLLLVSSSSFSAESEYTKFALEQAHKQGFMECDAAIVKAFENASGKDMRVNATKYQSNPNLLTLVSTWGSKGDSVFFKATIIKSGQKCVSDLTFTFYSQESCTKHAKKMTEFKYIGDTNDHIWLGKNEYNMLLQPIGTGCSVTYTHNQEA